MTEPMDYLNQKKVLRQLLDAMIALLRKGEMTESRKMRLEWARDMRQQLND